MVKICSTGLLKLNFETIPKNTFSSFCQKFPQAMDELVNFFCQFPNPWALRVSGMGCYTSKCEKSQNHCTLMYISLCSRHLKAPRLASWRKMTQLGEICWKW
jgi:hypothetical protein